MAASRSHVDPKIIEVAVALSDIEAVPDHKLVGQTKAYVAKIGFHLLHAFFQKKRTLRDWQGAGPQGSCGGN